MKPILRIVFLLPLLLYGCNIFNVKEIAFEAAEPDILTIEAKSACPSLFP